MLYYLALFMYFLAPHTDRTYAILQFGCILAEIYTFISAVRASEIPTDFAKNARFVGISADFRKFAILCMDFQKRLDKYSFA